MKENGNGTFYTGEEVQGIYPDIVPVYQAAFAGEPWFEVSKCENPSDATGCIGGLSAQSIGEMCTDCNLVLARPAYEIGELITNFERVANLVPTAWYTEGDERGLSLAAFCWNTTADFIAGEKYTDVPEMQSWLLDVLRNEPLLWLDEIFADREKKPSRNLANFAQMVEGFREEFQGEKFAFRTINERLIAACKRDFPETRVYKAFSEVPDRRSVIVIDSSVSI